MTAADDQQERLRGLMSVWRDILGLDEWHIDLCYRDGPYVRGDGEPSGSAIASTDVQWEYRRAQLYFRVDLLADEDDAEAEYMFVHEAMHILLNGQRAVRTVEHATPEALGYERLLEEHTATTLARAFIRARNSQKE